MSKRLIKIFYSGRYADRASSCASFEGAIRAASVRLLMDDYSRAEVHDHRFGVHNSQAHSMTMVRTEHGIRTTWTKNVVAYVREKGG